MSTAGHVIGTVGALMVIGTALYWLGTESWR